MSISTDRALYKSDFARNDLDKYYTEEPVTAALARRIPKGVRRIWEPACGRGDMVRVLEQFNFEVLPSDIKPEAPPNMGARKFDFLTDRLDPRYVRGVQMIASNPPFGDDAEAFVRQALSYESIRVCAFLLRSEWKHGKTRLDLFREQPFSKEIVLTWRPRWDWWLTPEQKRAAKIAAGKKPDDPDSSPRHNFSWFVWDREMQHQPTEWATRTD